MKPDVVIESGGIQIRLAPDDAEVADLVIMNVTRPDLRTATPTTSWIDTDVLRVIVENADELKRWLGLT